MRGVCVVVMVMIAGLATLAQSADNFRGRPNILWITAEDMSPTLGCYGDDFATTPHIDRLAGESVKYTAAFATAPVCSPARSCLINGVYAQAQGTHPMRSTFPIPEAMTGFPSFLRKVGYYTTNNVKTDYNSGAAARITEASWDESSDHAHWRNRDASQKDEPFFSVFNLMTSHQSRTMVWPYGKFQREIQSQLSDDEIHDPDKIPLPPYYPDTPIVRRAMARYYDCVTVMDKQVGQILQQLEADGLADDTIVFFYSDHGSGMPRHKRALLDSGMHVPMLVRFPEKWRHLAPGPHGGKPGSTTDRLVSFVDFAPTVLRLAGVELPGWMQGEPFLGPDPAAPRQYVYGHRDRVDEVIDKARSVRDGRYLYIRNYMPHLSYNQPTAWPDLGAIRHEFYRLTDRNTMTDSQWHFAGPNRPIEELYDCKVDPQNLHNLADAPEHQQTLKRLRGALHEFVITTPDVGFQTEAQQWQRVKEHDATPLVLGQATSKATLEKRLAAAERVGVADEKTLITHLLQANDPTLRYWSAVALSAREALSDKAVAALTNATKDADVSVRSEAANALARHGHVDAGLPVLIDVLEHDNLAAVLYAARAIELLGDKASGAIDAIHKLDLRMKGLRAEDIPATVVQTGDRDMAMFIGFSTNAFLNNVAAPSDDAQSWINLLEGDVAAGWHKRIKGGLTDKAHATIDHDVVALDSDGTNLWFTHETVWSDFELEVDAKIPAGQYNSGIGFRCGVEPRLAGYQCEIAGAKSGMIYAIGKGWVWPKSDEHKQKFKQMAGKTYKEGAWNHFRILCEGERIQIWVNGVKTADVRDVLFQSGHIALQHHGRGDTHHFKNVRVRPLTSKP